MAWFVAEEDFLLFGAPALAAAGNFPLSGAGSFDPRPSAAGPGSGGEPAKPKCSAPCSTACAARHLCHSQRGH
jgi:hypothetical protein